MADNKKLDSIIQIDGTEYEVIAKTAEKVAVPLTIKVVNGDTKEYTFDGSSDPVVEIKAVEDAGHAGIADSAKKVENSLTIKAGQNKQVTFNGSEELEIDTSQADFATEAGTAQKVENKLTINVIKDGQTTPVEFDGSEARTIDVGDANKIQVNMDNNKKAYATITISAEEPTAGSTGDIWFKYI